MTSPLTAAEATGTAFPVRSRVRVIVDNDFGGDPDGLFQLAHQLLSPSVEVRGVIASRNYAQGFYGYPGTAGHAAEVARELLAAMGQTAVVLVKGAEGEIPALDQPCPSEASRLIVQEAMREDVATPLYLVCGAGLTNVASAYLAEPRIASRIRLIWIGGPEYAGSSASAGSLEYNLGIDVRAAQVVFNQSAIPIWQVPRDTYRQALVSCSELEARIGTRGKVGHFLLGRLRDLLVRADGSLGETYVLGDSPLVLLSALQSSWDMDASSSRYVNRRAPKIGDAGTYVENPAGRSIRVFTAVDNRLMFEDLFAKIARADAPGAGGAQPDEQKPPRD